GGLPFGVDFSRSILPVPYRGNVVLMRGLSASAAGNKTKFDGPKSARPCRGVRRWVRQGRRARPGSWRRWPLGWLAAPVVAALVVAWAAAVPLPSADVTRQASAVTGLLAGS